MTTLRRTAKDLANLSKTKFEKWFEKMQKEYGKKGMKYLLDDMNLQRKMKGGVPRYRTFAQNFYNFMIAKEKGYPCGKALQYLNRKDVEYLIESISALLSVTFFRNHVSIKDCA
ncbi:MAG: hypothetical protein VZR09_03355 [Candidatus Gastranaerophilaceae bacterium]|nr:hypothetical protein [Candidatus Gastranaerophilaceae bacterium]